MSHIYSIYVYIYSKPPCVAEIYMPPENLYRVIRAVIIIARRQHMLTIVHFKCLALAPIPPWPPHVHILVCMWCTNVSFGGTWPHAHATQRTKSSTSDHISRATATTQQTSARTMLSPDRRRLLLCLRVRNVENTLTFSAHRAVPISFRFRTQPVDAAAMPPDAFQLSMCVCVRFAGLFAMHARSA